MCVFQEQLVVLGGWGKPHGNLNCVWVSHDGTQWAELESLPSDVWSPRHAFSALVFKDHLFVIGGCADAGLDSEVWRLSDLNYLNHQPIGDQESSDNTIDVADATVVRVQWQVLESVAAALFAKVGVPAHDSQLLARLLTSFDAEHRWSQSHGVNYVPVYCKQILAQTVNPSPTVQVLRDMPTVRAYGGDGGLGHIVCAAATEWAITAAQKHGTATATTRHHAHAGALGFYARMAVDRGCIAIVASSEPVIPLARSAHLGNLPIASPLCVGVPAGSTQPPLILDFNTKLFGEANYKAGGFSQELFARLPSVYFKQLGLQSAAAALGGVLAGIYADDDDEAPKWGDANQGGFIMVLSPSAFVEDFEQTMGEFVSSACALEPLPGTPNAALPGGVEAQNAAVAREQGLELKAELAWRLAELGAELGVAVPEPLQPPSRAEG